MRSGLAPTAPDRIPMEFAMVHHHRSNATLAFMIESHQRVMSHCERLLAAKDLSAEHRARLLRLRDEAASELARFTFAEAA